MPVYLFGIFWACHGMPCMVIQSWKVWPVRCASYLLFARSKRTWIWPRVPLTTPRPDKTGQSNRLCKSTDKKTLSMSQDQHGSFPSSATEQRITRSQGVKHRKIPTRFSIEMESSGCQILDIILHHENLLHIFNTSSAHHFIHLEYQSVIFIHEKTTKICIKTISLPHFLLQKPYIFSIYCSYLLLPTVKSFPVMSHPKNRLDLPP